MSDESANLPLAIGFLLYGDAPYCVVFFLWRTGLIDRRRVSRRCQLIVDGGEICVRLLGGFEITSCVHW
ncbi:uncharacterized protein BJX67DRAFT_348947 [Aspergillus lucknowensis]|uniref:Uncharacterized protein n=1 Tax=Aspergillus lucknowensis TaxID=176173 RepID=A0ABR4LVV9_9EURO